MKLNGQRNVTLEQDATPIQPHTEDALANHAPSHEEIRRRAYEIYLERDPMQAVRLMIGSGQNVNSKRSLYSHETGIAFRTRLLRFQMLKLPFRTRKRGRDQVNDDPRDFGKHGLRSPRSSGGHIYSPDP
jgi:hypothetical protein